MFEFAGLGILSFLPFLFKRFGKKSSAFGILLLIDIIKRPKKSSNSSLQATRILEAICSDLTHSVVDLSESTELCGDDILFINYLVFTLCIFIFDLFIYYSLLLFFSREGFFELLDFLAIKVEFNPGLFI